MNKLTTIIGLVLAASFLIGLATTLTRSSMIGFFDILPVYILMIIAIGVVVGVLGFGLIAYNASSS